MNSYTNIVMGQSKYAEESHTDSFYLVVTIRITLLCCVFPSKKDQNFFSYFLNNLLNEKSISFSFTSYLHLFDAAFL